MLLAMKQATEQQVLMIQADLPETPAEVIDIWLVPHSKRDKFGWPPTPSSDWRYMLRGQNGLRYLQSLRWGLQEVEIAPSMIYPKDMNIIIEMFKAYVIGEKNLYAVLLKSEDRFRKCCDYMVEHGVFPRPVVLEESEAGLKVLDGNHRHLAFFYLFGFFKIDNEETPCLKVKQKQNAWIAKRLVTG